MATSVNKTQIEFVESLIRVTREIRWVHEALESVCLAPQKRPILVGDIIDAMKAYFGAGLEIKVVEMEPVGKRGDGRVDLRGIYEFQNNVVTVLHRGEEDGFNYCNQRFIIAKELCQFLADVEQKNRTNLPGDLIENLCSTSGLIQTEDSEVQRQGNIDQVTKNVAMLLLVPLDEMEVQKKLLEEGKTDIGTIAETYKVPLRVVRAVLTKDNIEVFRIIEGLDIP